MTLYYWYTSNQRPPWHKLVTFGDGSKLYGYAKEPSQYFIDRFNLKLELKMTWEKITEC